MVSGDTNIHELARWKGFTGRAECMNKRLRYIFFSFISMLCMAAYCSWFSVTNFQLYISNQFYIQCFGLLLPNHEFERLLAKHA
jgi:hypothetical protein